MLKYVADIKLNKIYYYNYVSLFFMLRKRGYQNI